MAKSPRKIGIILSGGNPWELIFCIFHLEKNKIMRLPITVFADKSQPGIDLLEQDLVRHSSVKISDVKATGIEGLIIPGGTRLFDGLCNFASAGDSLRINDALKSLIKGVYRLEKPIGAFGESAFLVAKSLQGITRSGLVVTVGNDPKLQAGIEKCGAQAVITRPGEVVLDETNKIVTSGGELSTKRSGEVYAACENLLTGMAGFLKNKDSI
jgi:enhancing lycopene biosynthesis protein 2